MKHYLPIICLFTATSVFAAGSFSSADVCKAAISSEMGRDVKTMKSLKSDSEMPEITYTRDDGNKYRYQCRFDGQRVVWRTYFNDHLKVGWGRWRNDPSDPVITYKESGNKLELHNSSSGSNDSYGKKSF